MALSQSDLAKGTVAIPYPSRAGEVCGLRGSIALAANPQIGDIVEMVPLPPGCRPIDIIVDADDVDSNGAPTIAFDLGVMSGEFGDEDAGRTCGQEFFAASNVGQAGGVARPTRKEAYRVGTAVKARGIGIKFTAAAATFQAGSIGVTVLYATV